MRIVISFFIFVLMLSSCKDRRSGPEGGEAGVDRGQMKDNSGSEEPSQELETYRSEEWAVAFDYPDTLEVFEGKLPAQSPVINIYDPANFTEAPFAIHEDTRDIYIAILPKGYGVDGPGGARMSFAEWEGELPVPFNIDTRNSQVYLLENGVPWGFSLRFNAPPEGWNEYGSIFVHHGVNNFRAECTVVATGETKEMEECDPLSGEDEVSYYGELRPGSKKALNAVLQNLYFLDKGAERKPVSDLIRVEQPEPNQKITSPLKIRAAVRGYWLFEAEAPVQLVDENFKVLATTSLRAREEWMTEDFVPVEAEMTFSAPERSEGFLIFRRANPSGKPEKDRSFRLPVKF